MSLRAILVILVFMLVVGLSAYVSLNNPTVLNAELVFPRGFRPRVFHVVGWSFFLGFGMTMALTVMYRSRLWYGRWRDALEARARERIERRYAQGLEALLGGGLEERASVPHHVIDVARGPERRHQPPQAILPLEKRQLPQIAIVQRETSFATTNGSLLAPRRYACSVSTGSVAVRVDQATYSPSGDSSN